MWKFNLGFFIFVFFIYGNNCFEYPTNIIEELKWTFTPHDMANYIENQLNRNESRLISRSCFQDLKLYVQSLLRLRLWALQMFDANAKFPSGLGRGHAAALGAYDECLSVKSETFNIRGKYCLGRLPLYNFTNKLPAIPFTELHEPRLIDLPKGTVYLPWGVCLPDSCSARDFQILHLFIFFRFSEENCQTEGSLSRDLDNSDIAAISVLGVIITFVLCSTVYDIVTYYVCKDCGNPILRSFSIFSNGLKIVTIKDDPDAITCIYGLRTLSMVAIMYGFSYLLFVLSPLINWIDVLDWVLDKTKISILEAIICGDTFFVISGLLMSYNYLISKEKGIKFNIVLYYLNRIIRLTPALGIAVLVHATLLRHMGSGPIWPRIRDSWLVDNCRENWWSSLLYVQNYVVNDIRNICILQTWQLSVDMQLFILSPLILLPLDKAPKFTISAVVFLLVCSVLSPFLTAWVYKLKAIIATNTSLTDLINYAQYYYFPTHTRASSWLVGFLMGYFIYKSRTPNARLLIKKRLNIFITLFLWGLSMGVIVFSIFIGREMMQVNYDLITHALHMALVRPLWAVAIGWIIFACFHGYGGPINWLLSAPFFQVLSRITYSTYLINISIMFIMTHQTTIGLEFSDFHVFENFTKYLFISLWVGLAWTLLFESPMISLIKVLFCKTEVEDIISIQRKKFLKRIN